MKLVLNFVSLVVIAIIDIFAWLPYVAMRQEVELGLTKFVENTDGLLGILTYTVLYLLGLLPLLAFFVVVAIAVNGVRKDEQKKLGL